MGVGYSSRDIVKFNVESINLEGTDFCGNSPPTVFVGRFGYPNVNVGVMSPVKIDERSWLYDAPEEWAYRNLSARDVLRLRSNLINSRFKSGIKSFKGKLLDVAQEVGMAYKPVDMEVNLKNKPSKTLMMNYITSPINNSATVNRIKLTSNPKIETKVDKVVSDNDLKSVDALFSLYNKGVSENFLSKALSIGLFGLKKNRKLVPTRWSITATDDSITKKFLNEIRHFDEVEPSAFFGGYMGNHYLIMMFKDVWGFELFEMESPLKSNPWSKTGKFYATDFEDFDGRKKYVDETAGAYYAARLPIVEKLFQMRNQAGVIVIRIITEEDEFPLGVWTCREAAKKSLASRPLIFSDKELLLNYGKAVLKKKFGIDIESILKNSKLLNRIKTQERLIKWL
ncbi:MAG: hypothetical protein ABIH25_01415 [Candidatus Woesearchaeota archaeon]